MEQTVTGQNPSSDNWARIWEWVAGVIFSPVETMREIADRAAWQQALVVVVVVAVVNALIQAASVVTGANTGFTDFEQFGSAAAPFSEVGAMATGLGVASAFAEIFWRPIMWTTVTLILYLIAYLLGGRGEFTRLWAVLGFAAVPELLIAPFSAGVAFLAVLSPGLSLIGWLFLLPVLLLVSIWIVVLYVLGVREAMHLTTGRATATVVLPIAALVLFVLLVACLILALIFAFIGGASTW